MPRRYFTAREKELAHTILPILVRQVMAYQEEAVHHQNLDPAPYCIQYGRLATKVDGNPRKLGYPLGYIRQEFLKVLGEQWNEDIPHIQGIVVRQDTELPGHFFYLFLDSDLNPLDLNRTEREAIFRPELRRVYCYQKWLEVLEALDLEPAAPLNS